MRRTLQSLMYALFVSVLLAACGGGGGGGGDGDDSPDPAVRFSPNKIVVSGPTGSFGFGVTATLVNPKDFTNENLYVVIEDPQQVLQPTVGLHVIDSRTVLVDLFTSFTATAGHYQGDLTVHLCKDAGCTAEFPGSPVKLPYDITLN